MIKDYSPDNCRWVTNKEQQNNKRTNILYKFNGETKTLSEWSEQLGIGYKTLQKRIRNWGIKKAFETPLKTENIIDITGQKYGRLTVLSLVNTRRGANFECICDCGNITVQRGYNLRKGIVISCGCWKKEKFQETMKEGFKNA